MTEPDLVGLFVGPLERLGLSYMITGGVASVVYGDPRGGRVEVLEVEVPGDPTVDPAGLGAGRDHQVHMEIESRDGTRISVWRSGEGPPLLLVHGATADHSTTWGAVRSDLEKHFTTYAMDRRGRGGSGDTRPYALEREAEDVAAVVDAIGEGVSLLGHSYGALCALEASLLAPNLHRLILYEGVYLQGAELYAPGFIEGLEAMLTAGELEEMLVTVLRDLVGMPPGEIALLQSQRDAWSVRLTNTRTLPRELRAEESYVFAAQRFQSMAAPTLFLIGGHSPSRERENASLIAAQLPHARVSTLEGQQHAAMHTAPDVFVDVVRGFLLG